MDMKDVCKKESIFEAELFFLETEASLRNDTQFADNFYQNHQTGTSPFKTLELGW